MALFKFRARDRGGSLVEGNIISSSREEAIKELQHRQFYAVEVEQAVEQDRRSLISITKSIGPWDLSFFAYQGGATMGAGIPLLAGLELAAQQAPPQLKTALVAVDQDLREGNSLAQAMNKHPNVFPPLMVSMVEAGELGGMLGEVFIWLADHYEEEALVMEKIKTALAYPILVFVLTILALIFLLTFVLPGFAQLLDNMGVALPYLTRAVLNTSLFFINWGFILGVIFASSLIGLYSYIKSDEGRVWRDRVILRLPLIGRLITNRISARFCHVFGALLERGVPLLQALDVVGKTLDNEVLIKNFQMADQSLRQGRGLARPLEEAGIFPPLLLQMVAVGEETGRLPEFLLRVSSYYQKEVQRSLDRITAMLEPLLLLFLGCMVGIIVLAILLPLFNLIGSL